MQPTRQLSIKYIAALLLLVLFVAWLPANLVMASPLSSQQSEHHQKATSPCGDEKLTTSRISEPSHPHASVLHTDTCQGENCQQCSSCTALNPTVTHSDQLPLRWEQHYLSHQSIVASKRLERPPKS
ncbi:hypothetical protein [Nitrincola iocasae]|jgi:hypothetical protein|uniref:Uncharacterized protein n=1 Tax=Nitrincola iocasae TaxID=2614693 RepID=A0A5J6LIW1_9GAMM|nr:hypothetical protein [Nitrincola iocasae]QEW08333.1 hypothetical protein F5I99_18570 [Nitrincola iocasae]